MKRWSDTEIEQTMGNLLRVGVVLAVAVVLAGGILSLVQAGRTAPRYRVFHGEPADLRSLAGIVSDAAALSPRGIVQLGLLLLIATPVARVAFSLVAFALERDLAYVIVTTIVLSVLAWSLAGGGL